MKALLADENDGIACLANFAAALKGVFGFLWVGFYIVRSGELVLGPFQGPIACTRISRGRGVCGKAWADKRTVVVDDVNAFPGHIACSSLSRSEIVVPLRDEKGEIWGVLDVDSENLAAFDETDREALEKLVTLVERKRV